MPPGASLSITRADLPPLTAGRYYIGVFNPPGNNPQTVRVVTKLDLDLRGVVPTAFASTGDMTTNVTTIRPHGWRAARC
jgi:hypothetical protein